MDYVRVDFDDCYIYLENTVWTVGWLPTQWEYRAKELLKPPMWNYKRIKRMSKLPLDKKVKVWYNKSRRRNKNETDCVY